MPDISATTTSEAGFVSSSLIDDEWEFTIDATGEEGPTPNQALVADYASCFLPALRVAADKHGHEDLGTIQIESEADLDDGDDLESIAWTLSVEADLGGDGDDVVDLAEDICHVHDSVREALQADITLEDGADL